MTCVLLRAGRFLDENKLRWLGASGTSCSREKQMRAQCQEYLNLTNRSHFFLCDSQQQARRATARKLLGRWTQIAERLVLMSALAERGLARTEVLEVEATRS